MDAQEAAKEVEVEVEMEVEVEKLKETILGLLQ